MLRFEFHSNETRDRKVTRKSDGKEFRFMEQAGFVFLGGPYPSPVTVRVDAPLTPGVYDLLPESFRVGDYGRLELAFPRFNRVGDLPTSKPAGFVRAA